LDVPLMGGALVVAAFTTGSPTGNTTGELKKVGAEGVLQCSY